MISLEVDLGSIPAPIIEIECQNAEASCYPKPGGME